MKRSSSAFLCLLFALVVANPRASAASHTFEAGNGQFLLDGKPFQVISGEMHYARVPRAYWRARLKMAKAMGLNTISTYVFWNLHEPRPGEYDFSGENDVAEFVREAQQEGLYVMLRPGPYICSEWEFGGFPSWLLKDHSMLVRSSDPKFIAASRSWLLRLGQELAPLQIGNGGPPPSTLPPVKPAPPSLNSSASARRDPSSPENTGTAGSITGEARTPTPTRSCRPPISTGSYVRAIPSISTCSTEVPALAG